MDKPVIKKRNKMKGEKHGRRVDPVALEQVRELLGDASRRRDLLIEYLHLIQDSYGHISADHITALAKEMKLATTEVYEVATFYHHFDVVKEEQHAPPELTVRVCDSITCEMFGANALVDALEINANENVRIQRVPCVGRCEQAPVAVVGTNAIGQADAANVTTAINNNIKDAQSPSCVNYENYKQNGGYKLLKKVASEEVTAEEVMESQTRTVNSGGACCSSLTTSK